MSQARVGIVDYRAGNVRSIANAFDFLGAEVVVARSAGEIPDRTHLVLPGVGAYGHCAENLRASGLLPAIGEWKDGGRPLLGICVGMQLLSDVGEELGEHEGLGWIPGRVRRLQPAGRQRLPHVGWNTVSFCADVAGYESGDEDDFYFDHSFAYFCEHAHDVAATCAHGEVFAAVIKRENVLAAQFHPEKSQRAGLRFLEGFLAIR